MLAVVFILGCSKKQTNTATETSQKTFATPAEARQALQTAVQAKDDKAITQVLGPKAKTLVSSGDPAEDATATDSFAKKYDQMNRWVAMTDGSQVLYVGADNYPFPIPLAQDGSSRWYFDADAGEEELRARRIGSNELTAMDACRLIANAEELYHQARISTPIRSSALRVSRMGSIGRSPKARLPARWAGSTSLPRVSLPPAPQQNGGLSWILFPHSHHAGGIHDLCQSRQLSTLRHHDVQPGP